MSAGARSVALVMSSLSSRSGGVGEAVRALAEGLSAEGEEAHVYGLRDPGFEAERELWASTAVHAIEPGGLSGFAYAPRMGRALAGGGHDLVHLHGLWQYPSLAVAGWRRRCRGPVVISPHGMLDPWALRNSGWKKSLALALFERENLERADCLHVLNTAEAAAVRAMGLQAPLAIIPNGVTPPARAPAGRRPDLLGSDGRRVLLFLGRLHPKKAVLETLEAWSLALRRAPQLGRDWTLVVAGWDDGGHEPLVRERAAALGLGEHVHLPGAVRGGDKDALLACAEAFILASRSEGLPMSVLEAWAHATPVLMTRACNLPEGFDAGAAIEITSEPDGIAAALVDHLPRADLGEVGVAGRRLVEQRFTWARVAGAMREVHQWLISGGPAPPCVEIP